MDETSLTIAVNSGSAELVRYFIDNGADVNFGGVEGGSSPLAHAVIRKKKDIALILISSGAEVNKRDVQGWSPLSRALNGEDYSMADFLVKHGAKAAIDDYSVLLGWSKDNIPRKVKYLLANGLSINARNPFSHNLLDIAEYKGVEDVAKLLKERGLKRSQ